MRAGAGCLNRVSASIGGASCRVVADRIARLPRAEWVYGTANASIVMAAFLQVAPGGMR
ncbi:MAG TPA: RES domain-containing protein, partial [Phyllobacterium sp.]|nr:RES domain-containing protein [Phyllobacterium sp.]